MVKKAKEYKPGDFVFAKVKGYPAWPARVRAVNGKKYMVLFYGTNETANLPGNVIFDYKENKDKFLSKSVKRREFIEGVEQIDKDIAEGTELPADDETLPEPIASNDTTADVSGADDTIDNENDDTVAETTADGSAVAIDATDVSQQDDVPDSEDGALVIDESKRKVVKRRSSSVADGASKPKQSNKQPEKMAEAEPTAATTEVNEEQNKEDVETTSSKAKKTPKSVQKGRRNAKNVETSTPKADDEELPQVEVNSRGRRKIKPKRFMDEETEELPVVVMTKTRTESNKVPTPTPADIPSTNQEVPSDRRNGSAFIMNEHTDNLSLDEEMAIAARHMEMICPGISTFQEKYGMEYNKNTLPIEKPVKRRGKTDFRVSNIKPSEIVVIEKNFAKKIYEVIPKDEDSLFSEQVIAKLKKLDPITRAETEHKINCVLFEAEMQMLQGNSPRVMLTRCS